MKKDGIIIVGSFQNPKNPKIFGGIAKSCDEILSSNLFAKFEIIKIDSTSKSVPPPSLFIRLIFAVKRIFQFSFKLIYKNPSACLLFCSDGWSATEKGIMLMISKGYGTPCIIFPRAGNLMTQAESTPSFNFILKKLFSFCDIFLCQGENWKKFAINSLKINKDKIEIVPNWTATSELIELGLNRKIVMKKELEILFVGWIIKEKGILELLNSFQRLINKNYKVRLKLIGDGDYRDYIKAFSVKNKLDNLISVSGWIQKKELLEIYKNSDIFVLPSWNEGMPNALIESLSSGLPSIATSVGVIEDYFFNNKDLLIIPVKNENKLTKALEKLIIDINFRKKISKNGFDKAKEKFSKTKGLSKLVTVINKLIK